MSLIFKWAKKINWDDRVKAICKPCWEIKYCPYGSLVEDFPLSSENTEKSCRVFGHDCPVFHVAEPFTETKELRKITRNIPRVTQFRVMKRENQICQICKNSVIDEDIEFDHIIPWSKGGSSDESNIRLLCSNCNRKRGNKFEDEYLISGINEFLTEPLKIKVIDFLKESVDFGQKFYFHEKRFPDSDDFAICLADGEEKTNAEIKGAEYLHDIVDFFNSEQPKEISGLYFAALKYRWGFLDRRIHRIKHSASKYNVDAEKLVQCENQLIKKMGINIKQDKSTFNAWLKK